MNIFLRLIHLLILFPLSAIALEKALPTPNSVTLLTSELRPFENLDALTKTLGPQGVNIDSFRLEAVERLEASLSSELPKNEDAAKKAFQRRVQKIGNEKFNRQLLDAYQGQFYVIRHGIKRYPAVVFDDRWIVYGVEDALQALTIYQSHQSSASKERAHD